MHLFLKQQAKRIQSDVDEYEESREYADENNGLQAWVGCIIQKVAQAFKRMKDDIP